jgi:predicted ATPase with chaperone activity
MIQSDRIMIWGSEPRGIVGLLDKAVAEARERIRQALIVSGVVRPGRRITVHLVPADLPKQIIHGDLPIGLGQRAAFGHCTGRTERLRGVRRTLAR